jgi:hypothetical protein
MTMKKLALGVAVMIAAQVTGALALGVSNMDDIGRPTLSAWFLTFASALAGAWIARRAFYTAALSYWAVQWAAVAGILYSIAAPAGTVSWASMAQTNVWLVLASGSALLAGAAAAHVARVRFSASGRVAT